MSRTLRNWAGNYTYIAAHVHRPETVDQVIELATSHEKLRALGTRHSFNAIADSPADLISLERLNRVISLDPAGRTVTIEAGVKYGHLAAYLNAYGFALHNLASLPHISVAGACATATHGSGVRNGNLATAVSAMELVTADGKILTCSRQTHGEQFNGMVVHLGALGIVTKLTLDILPTFNIRQCVYENLPVRELEKHFDEITSSGYSVSLFTNWQRERINQVWVKRLATDDYGSSRIPLSATPAPADRHPIDGISAENCTVQMDLPGPWHERLPHFRMEFTPSSGEELQSEYFVSREHAVAAFTVIAKLHERITPLLFISEIRTIAADELWMSPAYQRDSVAFHFTWKQDWPAVREILPIIEAALAPFAPRPHWGKLFTMRPANLQSHYALLNDFKKLLMDCDPAGKFRNPFLQRNLFE